MALLVVGRGGELDDADVARVQLGDQPLDRAPLARGVPALEDDADRRAELAAADQAAERQPELGEPRPGGARAARPPPPWRASCERSSSSRTSHALTEHPSPGCRRARVVRWRSRSCSRPIAARIITIPNATIQLLRRAMPVPAHHESDREQDRVGAERVGQGDGEHHGAYLSSPRCRSLEPAVGRRGSRGPRQGRLSGRRGRRARLLPRPAARQAGAGRGPGRRRQDRAGQGALARHRSPPGPPAVLRGPRRGQGPLRVELPQAAAADPGRVRRRGRGRPGRPRAATSSARSSCSPARCSRRSAPRTRSSC